MTAKEKAKEIYSKFEDEIIGLEGNEWWESAKNCSLFHVNEILKVLLTYAGREYDFYKEVKTELEQI